MVREITIAVDAKATLGEGPCWDATNNCLIWVDILEKTLHLYYPENEVNKSIKFDQYIGAAVLRESGGFILAMQNGIYHYDLNTETKQLISDPERHLPNNRFNDGKCDPAGRFWAGTMELNGSSSTGALYYLDKDLSVKKSLSNLTISNGLAWSPNYQKMYFIDTPTRQIMAYDYSIDTGSIKNGHIAVTIPFDEGNPDGMTIDSEGMIWVAHFGGSKVSRWDPLSGICLEEIEVPAKNVTSCVFGGEQLDTLYITTARHGLSANDLKNHPHAGAVFCVKTGIRGVPSYRFKG